MLADLHSTNYLGYLSIHWSYHSLESFRRVVRDKFPVAIGGTWNPGHAGQAPAMGCPLRALTACNLKWKLTG